uniref:AP2/ERF domain-containing protein n=1 Tax=Oryza meridionalis TaxID=40149 RepID=A0A0E0CBM3_9ORYZ
MAGRQGFVSSSRVQCESSSMATMNNWLAFSLSPQDQLPPSQANSTLISAAAATTTTGDSSAGDVCFNIPQDWSMRGSELSALIAEPKLEDFLGGISFSEQQQQHHHGGKGGVIPSSAAACYASSGSSVGYLYPPPSSSSLQFADSVMVATSSSPVVAHDGVSGGGMVSTAAAAAAGGNGGIGLSMIKNWLRSQPAQALSLSMNMAGATTAQGGGAMALLAGAGERGRTTPAAESLSTSAHGATTTTMAGGRKETNEECSGSTGAVVAVVGSESGGSGAVVEAGAAAAAAARKSVDTFGQRTSIYRGVTRHRWTGRYEAHLWDNSCRREGQTRKGRQGGYDKEEKAARAYDLAALKYWGPTTTTNFPVNNYEKELEEMKHMTRQEFVASLRRKSSGFSRGASIYRGVTRHHQHGRWQARIGRVAGNKDLYLGTFSTQEEAAEAYDIAAIKFRGLNAVTNFDMSRYDVKSILDSAALPVGTAAKRLKDAEAAAAYGVGRISSQLGGDGAYAAHYGHHHHHTAAAAAWPTIAFQAAPPPTHAAAAAGMYHPYAQPLRGWCKQEQDHAVIAAAHSLQDLHHLNLGAAAAHDFFSAAAAAQAMHQQQQHGLGSSIDNNASLEHSTGSNSVVYNGDNGGGGGGYIMPTAAAVASSHDHGGDGGKQVQMGYDSYLVGADAYGGGGGGRMPSWAMTPASAPAATSSSDMTGVCHGAQLFSVWNDT